jgi:hypothetical protein
MSNTKSSPGPWAIITPIKPLRYQITSRCGTDLIAELSGIAPSDKANARLIAAAPEMLDALYLALAVLKRHPEGKALVAVEKAINKADGRLVEDRPTTIQPGAEWDDLS